MNRNLQRFPDVPLGVEIVTHGPVAAVVGVVVVADPEVDPGQEESQYPHCPVAWCTVVSHMGGRTFWAKIFLVVFLLL